MKKFFCHTCLLISLAVYQYHAFAQDSAKQPKKWNYIIEPYLMFPNMSGTVGVADLPDTEIDAAAGDIFSHLKFGAMLYGEVYSDRWAITSDILYMNLAKNVKSGTFIKGGEVTSKQFVWEVAGLRKLLTWFEVGAGLRLSNLDAGVNILVLNGASSTVNKEKSVSKTWVDPIIVSRIKTPAKRKLSAQLRTDIGGFGIGSKFSWQAQFDGVYQFSKLFNLNIGYRFIGINYEKGSNQDRFLYDVNTYGPFMRFGFSF